MTDDYWFRCWLHEEHTGNPKQLNLATMAHSLYGTRLKGMSGRSVGRSTSQPRAMLTGLSLPFRVCSKKLVENHGSFIHHLGLDNWFLIQQPWFPAGRRVSQREWAINLTRPPTLAMIMTQIKSSALDQQYSRDTFVIITNALRKCSQTSPLLAASEEAVGSKSKKQNKTKTSPTSIKMNYFQEHGI